MEQAFYLFILFNRLNFCRKFILFHISYIIQFDLVLQIFGKTGLDEKIFYEYNYIKKILDQSRKESYLAPFCRNPTVSRKKMALKTTSAAF